MSVIAPVLPLPGDASWIRNALDAPGGLESLPSGLTAHLERAVAGLDLAGLIAMAETRAPAQGAGLYRLWLRAHPTGPAASAAHYNLGVALRGLGLPREAATAFAEALRCKADLWQAHLALGLSLEASGDPSGAVQAWQAALPPDSARRDLLTQLARLREDQGQLGAAITALTAALSIDPDQPDLIQHLVHDRQRTAAWPPDATGVPGLSDRYAAGLCGPLGALALHDDPAKQRRICAAWIARKAPPVADRLAPQVGYRHERIRIGYLSSDFCRHAMSFLMAEVFERHDRARFDVHGYCASPEDGSEIRARVRTAFDSFTPIIGLTDLAAAQAIRADEIDVLIDLNGLTRGARIGVLRWRPAPVQVSYLGFIGPVPLPELDWFLCDQVSVPPCEEAHYMPRPLRIEGCFQANDSRMPTLPAVSRSEEGLPDRAMVYACMSHHYKVTEAVFAAWCRVVAQVPGAVLWLIDDNPESRAALSGRWQAAGLAAGRLIFAARTDPDRYRARLALADLFLDTAPYNAGTVASDALRMGLPVLTLAGRAFAARMGASLLGAVGLPDCIAVDLKDYETRAVAMGRDPQRLDAARAHLAGGAWARTLGDSAGFTRRLEAALASVALRAPDPGC